ncbi:MAG: Holliday junction DNA helicase RuvA [Candidatus Fraserbacteria bacterium RBG_16_55_9]|uniref:Holliday junction branch migration complex subunit RuvA n=1 Tax=Fraserbacteria sp. (strain RBG_16_55_9) TaxID=1817864 RepID=A0A1F5UUX4_FRAXR|nr:MAG: Holliday junction DNA helicase RuvA [Candidatus Fraserbacteria bacterium RBG_16_55_9]
MIHHLEGMIVESQDEYLVMEVGGIGYRIYTSRVTREEHYNRTGLIKLYTHLHVREDEITLYGFSTPEERELFELLLTVTGVGPKVALGILSATTPQRLQEAIVSESTTSLTGIKGIGKKTAERLILELRDKIARIPLGGKPLPAYTRRDEVALRALTRSLGFGEREARQALEEARATHGEMQTEELIKRALELLSR